MVRSDDRVSAHLPGVAAASESVFLDAERGWRVWAVDREDPVSDEELAVMAGRTGAPVLSAYVMDSDCAVVEALGTRTGPWRTCLGRASMAAYMAESGASVDDWFASAEQATRAAARWAREAGCEPSETVLAAAFAAFPDPFVETVFIALLEGLGVRTDG
ncbi:hypothetical protein [Streptomyces sp. VRA16 Mangrove soil]|uniref:hypothetical protein n=1 Tax=Streptomyces sp. VRA16 Mangrove soil TaxID=2817434 RepID=UPI001A9DAE0F|nr:hypothetical protein [Streptomyces sp. VRA16 Mangrove soil]MBO1334839.1 hypothetical protein [Streptomyces sp. VRA16 Mangrove soil]